LWVGLLGHAALLPALWGGVPVRTRSGHLCRLADNRRGSGTCCNRTRFIPERECPSGMGVTRTVCACLDVFPGQHGWGLPGSQSIYVVQGCSSLDCVHRDGVGNLFPCGEQE